jgi:hypothetical protein
MVNEVSIEQDTAAREPTVTLQPSCVVRVISNARLTFEQTDVRGVRNRTLDAEEIAK